MSPNNKQEDDELQEQLRWSTIVPNTAREDRGEIRRCFDPLRHPELGVHGCRTLYETFRRGVALNPLGPCMGFRAVSSTGFATPYIYTSYTECLARVNAFAAGLDTLQLVAPNEDDIRPLGLFMKNCMEWVLAEHAVFSLGGATVPLYDTLGPDTVRFVLAQTATQSVVCTRAELSKLCQVKASGETPHFTTVILVDGVTPDAAAEAEQAGLQVLSYAKVEAVGAHHIATTPGGHKHTPPKPTDIATFCYTSGTTGDPKGALITHLNVITAISGMALIPELAIHVADRHLSYLPLAHIFERVVMAQMFAAGSSVAFFRGDPTLLIEDLQACRPTLLIAAPRVLNKIYDKIMTGMAAAGGLKKKLFDAGLAAKTAGLQRGHLTHAVYDRLLFSKIPKALGMDHVRVLISGSAPLSDTVMTFFRCIMGVPVIEGYGQTEGAAAATISHPDDVTTMGHVGGPTASVEIMLQDVPEMGYLHTDRVHGRGDSQQPCHGRGEICVRGPNVFAGYYKDPVKTRETIDEQGWLHSGDIGLWRPDGSLQIIDRKKNIFKLSQGEYVAPEKIESILTTSSPLIAQCFVYGDSLQSSLVAVVVPDEEPVRLWAQQQQQQQQQAAASTSGSDLSSLSFAEICQSPQLKEAILKQITSLSKENGLHGFETVKAIHIDSTLFSVENDMMTPTFKLKRQKVRDRFEAEIAALYASLPPPRSKL